MIGILSRVGDLIDSEGIFVIAPLAFGDDSFCPLCRPTSRVRSEILRFSSSQRRNGETLGWRFRGKHIHLERSVFGQDCHHLITIHHLDRSGVTKNLSGDFCR